MARAGADSISFSASRDDAGVAAASWGFWSGSGSFSAALGGCGSTYGGGLRGGNPTCDNCTVAGTPAPESFCAISARTRDRKAGGRRWSTSTFVLSDRRTGTVRAPGVSNPGVRSPPASSSSTRADTESTVHCSGQSVRRSSFASARARSSASCWIWAPANGAAATNAAIRIMVYSTRMTTRRFEARRCSTSFSAADGSGLVSA